MQDTGGCWNRRDHVAIVESTSKHLWRHIQKNAKERTPEDVFLQMTRLSSGDLKFLAKVHFLISDEAVELMNTIARQLLMRLSKSSAEEVLTARYAVKGRVDWERTFAARASAGGDPSLFISKRKSAIFDLMENRVLKFMIQNITEDALAIFGNSFKGDTVRSEYSVGEKWVEKIERLFSLGSKYLKNPYMRQISPLINLSEKDILEAEKARGQWYTMLAETARIYKNSKLDPFSYLQERLKQKILEPINWNTLYEVAVLFNIIDTLHSDGWDEHEINLIGRSAVVSNLAKNGATLHIYYQSLPDEFKSGSKYGNLMTLYNLSEGLRRPDIILECMYKKKKKFLIIEVKRSKQREYLIDGAYKLLGYLKDYEGIKNRNVSLQGLLVGWSGISNSSSGTGAEVYLSSWGDLSNNIRLILEDWT